MRELLRPKMLPRRRFLRHISRLKVAFMFLVVLGFFFVKLQLKLDIYVPADSGVCHEPTGNVHIYGQRDICFEPDAKTILFMQFSSWTLLDLCSLVTAAKRNPKYGICVLQAEGVHMKANDRATLAKIRKLQITKLQGLKLVSGTPLADWYRKACTEKSARPYLTTEMADGLRYVYLYKFGAAYLDTDCLTLQTFDNLTNVLGLVDGAWSVVNNAVMIFDRNNRFIHEVMEQFVLHVNPKVYGSGGPGLLRRIFLERFYDFLDGSAFLLPPHVFYPIFYGDKDPKAFKAKYFKEISEKYEDSVTIHLYRSTHAEKMWNSIEMGSFVGEILKNDCMINFDSGVLQKYV